VQKYFKILGICIAISSVFSFTGLSEWSIMFPVIFSLGCIVYGMGVIMEMLSKK